jgi:hypothetical protein
VEAGVLEAGVVIGVEDPLGPAGVVLFLGGGTMALLLGLGVVTTGELGELWVGDCVDEAEAGGVEVDCEISVAFS